jgi:hypothetical protein
MRKIIRFYILVFGLCVLGINLAFPVYSAVELSNTGAEYRFGQVKSLSRPLQWRKLTTPHFEIFFYQGLEELAERSARILQEEAFDRVFPDFRNLYIMNPYRRIRVVLFASRNEYQNSQASGLSLTDTSEGVAHILINRLVVIGQPTYRDLRGVLTHEITHLITIGPFKNNLLYGVNQGVPGWVAEGLAEYYMPPETRFANREVALRDVVLRDQVDPINTFTKVSGNLHYAESWSLVDFIARKYGPNQLGALLEAVVKQGHRDATFQNLFGLSLRELWTDWRAELTEIYLAGADLPAFSENRDPVLPTYRDQSMVKVTAGGKIFFLSNHLGRIHDLYLAEGDQIRRLTEKTVFAYDLAPDGRQLIFLSDDEGERRLYLLDLETGLQTLIHSEVTNPIAVAWSPQGDRIAVAANVKGDADLYLIDPEGRFLGVIAATDADETDPAWSPHGEQLIYVSPREQYDQLYLWEESTTRLLTRTAQHHRKPVWNPGGTLYCLTGELGYYRPATVNLTDGTTRTIWPYRETVLALTPTDDGFLVTLYNDKRSEFYRYQPSF